MVNQVMDPIVIDDSIIKEAYLRKRHRLSDVVNVHSVDSDSLLALVDFFYFPPMPSKKTLDYYFKGEELRPFQPMLVGAPPFREKFKADARLFVHHGTPIEVIMLGRNHCLNKNINSL